MGPQTILLGNSHFKSDTNVPALLTQLPSLHSGRDRSGGVPSIPRGRNLEIVFSRPWHLGELFSFFLGYCRRLGTSTVSGTVLPRYMYMAYLLYQVLCTTQHVQYVLQNKRKRWWAPA